MDILAKAKARDIIEDFARDCPLNRFYYSTSTETRALTALLFREVNG